MKRAKRQKGNPASGEAAKATRGRQRRAAPHPIWLLAGVGFLLGLSVPFVLPFDLVPRPPGSAPRDAESSNAGTTKNPPAGGPKWEIPALSKSSVVPGLSRVGPKGAQIRAKPGTGPVIARVLPGTRLEVVATEKGWVEVRYGLRSAGGWVPARYIEGHGP